MLFFIVNTNSVNFFMANTSVNFLMLNRSPSEPDHINLCMQHTNVGTRCRLFGRPQNNYPLKPQCSLLYFQFAIFNGRDIQLAAVPSRLDSLIQLISIEWLGSIAPGSG